MEAKDKDEIELIDLISILWKKKWLIIVPAFFMVLGTGTISFILPQKWEVDALIQPSKFLIKTEGGQYEEVVIVPPEQIASMINQGSYNHLIAAQLNLNLGSFPNLKAERIRDTQLVRIATQVKNIENGKAILLSLFDHIRGELDEKADIEINEIENQIKSEQLEKTKIEKEIGVLKTKLAINHQRREEIEQGISDIRKRIENLENEQRLNLKNENRSESVSLGLLLYSNEIQQSLQYLDTLKELLNNKKIEEENTILEIRNKENEINQIENTIENLKEKKGRIDYSKIIKIPTSSPGPVAPNKLLNVIIAGLLSLMIFTLLAFFVEYIQSQKLVSPENKKNRF